MQRESPSDQRPQSRLPTERVCLVLQSGIGDVVHGLPLVNALKRDDPARKVTWIVERGPAPLLRHHPAVDDVLLFDSTRGLTEVMTLYRRLRGRDFDYVLNCGIYFKSAIPTLLARAPHKLGFGRDRANDFAWLTANHRLPARGPRHRQDMYLELLGPLGVDPHPLEWRITLTEGERAEQSRFFAEFGAGPTAAIVPTSAGPAKDWSTERFAEVATRLQWDYGFRVLLLGGPGVREERRAREVMAQSEADIVFALGPELRRLVYLEEGCDLVIAPDTGPLHIARALNTPVIGLYGHTDPARSGPYGLYQDLIVDRYNYDAPGVPYTGPVEPQHPARAGCRMGRMELIRVADVLEKVAQAVTRYVHPSGEQDREDGTPGWPEQGGDPLAQT